MQSVTNFLSQIIDYAGLFPPAKLPMADAIINFTRYRQQPEGWMLSRFVCPIARLAELAPYCEKLWQPGDIWPVSALTTGETTDLTGALKQITKFLESYSAKVTINVMESKLPSPASSPSQAFSDFFGACHEAVRHYGKGSFTIFWELTLSDNWFQEIPVIVKAIAEDNHNNNHDEIKMGVKLRTGGVVASMFPTPSQVAWVISWCAGHTVALKLTAGLHHPLRHHDSSMQTDIHGFLNVFAAGILAFIHKLPGTEIQKILEDQKATHFKFSDNSFSWQQHQVSSAEVALARHKFMISFGSCSFTEPVEDLKKMEIIF